jgi:hypothetical protein
VDGAHEGLEREWAADDTIHRLRPWKEVLERYLADFLAFFFPQAYAEIDWRRGYTFLDKELQQVVRDAALGRRLADKLAQVWRRGGEET